MPGSDLRLTIGVTAGYVAALSGPYSLPVVVGSLMQQFSVAEAGVGLLLGVEMLALALVSFWFALAPGRFTVRWSVACSLGFLGVGYATTLITTEFWIFCLARALMGIGEGILISLANSAAARASNPERVFAVAQLWISATTALLLVLIPYLIAEWDYPAALILTLAIVSISALWMNVLPEHRAAEATTDLPFSLRRLPHLPIGILCILAYFVFSLSETGIYLFSERLAGRVGFDAADAGLLLGIGTGVGLLGPVLAIILHVRFGRTLPISTGLLVTAASFFGMAATSDRTIFTACVLGMSVGILFVVPYLMGLLAELDEEGSWTTLSAPIIASGLAVGPILMGLLAEKAGYAAMGWVAGTMTLSVLALVLTALTSRSFKKITSTG